MDESWGTIRVSIDFPGAEDVWVVSLPVYRHMILAERIDQARDLLMTSLAEDAGRLLAERKSFGENGLRG